MYVAMRWIQIYRICATTNISKLIDISTCKRYTQSDPLKFSKKWRISWQRGNNYFFKMIKLKSQPYSHSQQVIVAIGDNFEHCDFIPLYANIAENRSKYSKSNSTKILLTKILDI